MIRFHTSRVVSLAVLAAAAALPAAAVAAPAAAATSYTVTDMGSLGGGQSIPSAINATGQATGYSSLSTTYTISCGGYPPRTCQVHPRHAFLYANGTMTDLGTLGGHNSQGNAINQAGQVAGSAETKKGGQDAALWSGKKTVDLGALAPLAGSSSVASGINDSGQVVGSWGSDASPHAFLYSNGAITSLPESGFTGCQARAINNTGQIAGMCTDTSGNTHLVLWQNGTITDLGTLAGVESVAINSNGQIAGTVFTGGTTGGFLYNNGTITNLGIFAPNAINDNGVMVGGSSIDSGGTVQDLNSLIPAGSGYQIQIAGGINDTGQIVAYASYSTQNLSQHAVLLNPSS
jgi:probable HAF family extracellular repeat protein